MQECDYCGKEVIFFVELVQLTDKDFDCMISLHTECWEKLDKPGTIERYEQVKETKKSEDMLTEREKIIMCALVRTMRALEVCRGNPNALTNMREVTKTLINDAAKRLPFSIPLENLTDLEIMLRGS